MPEYDEDTDETYPTRKEEADALMKEPKPRCLHCEEEGIDDLNSVEISAGFWTDFKKFIHNTCVLPAHAEGTLIKCVTCGEDILADGPTRCSFCLSREKFTENNTMMGG